MPSGAAGAIPGPETLVDFVYGLPAPYRANASWLMSSATAAVVSKMKGRRWPLHLVREPRRGPAGDVAGATGGDR